MRSDALESRGDIPRRLHDLEREVQRMRAARRGEHMAIGRGGLLLYDAGGILARGGGSITITGDGGNFQTLHPSSTSGELGRPSAVLGPNYDEVTGALYFNGLLLQDPNSVDIVRAGYNVALGRSGLTVGTPTTPAWEATTYAGLIQLRADSGIGQINLSGGQYIADMTAGIFLYGSQIVLDAFADGGSTFITHDTTSATAPVCIISATGEILRSTSGRKYKRDIADADHDAIADAVLALRPRTWRDRREVERDPATTRRHLGVIAEEAAEDGLADLVTYNDETAEAEGFGYPQLTVPLAALAQRQQRLLDAQAERITVLETELAALAARVDALTTTKEAP